MYNKSVLPEYPVKRDLWDTIAEDKRPVMVYGMGNGADKLFERLNAYGVVPREVFASDGFVRGHKFRGYEVKSFSRIKEEYSDFVILLSFASNRPEVIEMIAQINENYDMYIPDMPVAGGIYFDKKFYNGNYEKIRKAYDALSDEDSKNAFASVINYKLSGKLEYLMGAYSDVSDIYSLLPTSISTAVDAGAYNGDTVLELLKYRESVSRIYAFEPDARNYKRLCKSIDNNQLGDIVTAINSAVWSDDRAGELSGSGNRNSSVSSTASYQNREECINLQKIDTAVKERVDYIKYDVEGAEYEALLGSHSVISLYRPALLVSLYHRSEDIFSLINYVNEKYPDYSLYLRRTLCFPAWEIALIAVK